MASESNEISYMPDDCEVACMQVIRRWNHGVDGHEPGTGFPCRTSLRISGPIPENLIHLELDRRFSRKKVRGSLADLDALGLLARALSPGFACRSIEFDTLFGESAEIVVGEPDETGHTEVKLRRPGFSITTSKEIAQISYLLLPLGTASVIRITECKKAKQTVPPIRVPIIRGAGSHDSHNTQRPVIVSSPKNFTSRKVTSVIRGSAKPKPKGRRIGGVRKFAAWLIESGTLDRLGSSWKAILREFKEDPRLPKKTTADQLRKAVKREKAAQPSGHNSGRQE